ncbi:MAG: helix-turn-helix transcriptional regulator [Clostridia bacterium]|nr:helix-turn-helix transcriptional regulator [Clostridia bacterium]
MEKPFILISGLVVRRDEFDVKNGNQNTWALFHMKEGSFELDYGDGVQTITSGDTVIFNDTTNFRRRVVTPIIFVYIKFRVNPHCPFSLDVPLGKVKFNDEARFQSTIRAYESVIHMDDRRMVYYKEHLLEDILFQVFCESSRHIEAENPLHSNDPLILAAKEYVLSHIKKEIHIDDICRAVSTNPSTLNWHFRRELGVSVGTYITSERMKRAKNLLRGTTYSISEVAALCGYENVYYFSTAFRKNCGLSPTEYRSRFG